MEETDLCRCMVRLGQLPANQRLVVLGHIWTTKEEARQLFEDISRTQPTDMFRAALRVYKCYVRQDDP